MNAIQKEKITQLINELVGGNHSEERGNEIHHELDKLIIDQNGVVISFGVMIILTQMVVLLPINFFEKIQEYQLSDECQRNQYVISLVNDLLKKFFKKNQKPKLLMN